MSSTKTTKGRAPATHPDHHSDQDTITVSESQPPPGHSTKPKGKNAVRHYSRADSSAAPTPSSSRAVDEAPAAQSAVENDQLRSEGIPRLPENLEAAQQEIASLNATIQRLQQQSTPKKGGNRYSRKLRSTQNTSRNHQQQSSGATSGSNSSVNSRFNARKGTKQFPHRRSRPSPSDDEDPSVSGDSDSSDGSRRSGRHHGSHKRSYKIEDPDKLDNGVNPTYKQWKDLMDGKMYRNRDWWKTEQDRMFYVFGRTEGKARDYLHARWGPDSIPSIQGQIPPAGHVRSHSQVRI